MARIKALPKPIRTVIHIVIYSYWDKTNGNNYCSARCYLNGDYENILVVPIEYGTTDHCEEQILKTLSKQHKRLKDLPKFFHSDYLKHGIYKHVEVKYVNQKDCKRFGTL